MPQLVAVWNTFWVHLCCEMVHVSHELLEDYGDAARPTVISPGGMNGVEVGSMGASPVSKAPTYLAALSSLAVHPGASHALIPLLSISLSSFLCLCHRLYYLVSFISMALISMESKYSNKHIRLNIGLCRKRRNVSCLLPALWHDSRWMK